MSKFQFKVLKQNTTTEKKYEFIPAQQDRLEKNLSNSERINNQI